MSSAEGTGRHSESINADPAKRDKVLREKTKWRDQSY